MTLTESIATLERLTYRATDERRRLIVELRAHMDVRDGCRTHPDCYNDQERDWYETAYAEAQLKQELEK